MCKRAGAFLAAEEPFLFWEALGIDQRKMLFRHASSGAGPPPPCPPRQS